MGIDTKTILESVENYIVMRCGGSIVFSCQEPFAGVASLPAHEIKGVATYFDETRNAYVLCLWTGSSRLDRETSYRRWFDEKQEADQYAEFVLRSLGESRSQLESLLRENIKAMQAARAILMAGDTDVR